MAQIYSINQLRDLVSPVAKQFGVKRVYVFGSYGRKEATAKSDLDLRIDAGNIRSAGHVPAFSITIKGISGKCQRHSDERQSIFQ